MPTFFFCLFVSGFEVILFSETSKSIFILLNRPLIGLNHRYEIQLVELLVDRST